MYAYLVGHMGIGDSLFMIGALHYLSNYYEKTYYLCKDTKYNNVSSFFSTNTNIYVITYKEKEKIPGIRKILRPLYKNKHIDIFISGSYPKKYFKSKITNQDFLQRKIIKKKYTLKYDTINNTNYRFLIDFYSDIGLNLTQFYENFTLPFSIKSKTLFESISNYYIIFIQSKNSKGIELNIELLKNKYLSDNKSILICNDCNLYNIKQNPIKFKLAQEFVLNNIINYVDTIKNADEIYIIDSCFTGIVLPFLKTNRLKAEKVRIILRDKVNKYKL